jgi:hypothetical protein
MQYMLKKSQKWGIKVWCLSDSKSNMHMILKSIVEEMAMEHMSPENVARVEVLPPTLC